MSEEGKTEFNGGTAQNPAETNAEYRDGGRYSDCICRENDVSNAGKDAERTGIDEEKVYLPGDNKSREEIESQFRNDPRFAALFDHSKTEKKVAPQWSIKVGGLRLTPKRILILSGFLLVILFCLGGSLFYAFKDLSKYRDFAEASSLLQSGDYDGARKLFVRVLRDDPNKEAAVEAMAQIYHHFGDWNNEAFFRQRIMRLNPLSQEAFQSFLESAFRARNFGSIYSLLNLRIMDNPDLPPEEGALFVITALNSGHVSAGRSFYEGRKKADPGYFSGTEYGRLAEFMLNAGQMNMEQVRNHMESLDEIKNPHVRFEKIVILVRFLTSQNTRESDERTEKLLLEATQLNNFSGAPLLANYYFSHYRFDDTIRICEEYLKTKINAIIPILYGESCVLNGQPERIQSILDMIRSLRGRQARIITAYLEALKAFSEGDDTRLPLLLQSAGSTIETPLSSLMRFQVALKQDASKDIRQRLFRIMREQPFLDFPQRARSAALQYLLEKSETDLASSPELLNTCAEIASLIQTPDDDVSFLRRIILMDHYKRNVLTEDEIQSALMKYPGDPVLLMISTKFCLMNRKPDQAMDYITELRKQESLSGEAKSSADVLHMLTLDQLGRKDEAEREFRSLVEKDEKGDLLCLYFEFCVENGFVESLKSLASWLEALPADSPRRSALPFVRAEILFAEGKEDEALASFEKNKSGDPRFVFHAASRLADANRNAAALSHYLSIRNSYPDKALVNLNLSELYAGMGDMKNALACAEAAWQSDPKTLLVRYIYAKRLYEAGKNAEAISVLKFPQYKASFPKDMLELWSKAIRAQIKSDFAAERYSPAMENTKFLLIYFPDDKSGLDYLEQLEKIRRHESVGGRGAS